MKKLFTPIFLFLLYINTFASITSIDNVASTNINISNGPETAAINYNSVSIIGHGIEFWLEDHILDFGIFGTIVCNPELVISGNLLTYGNIQAYKFTGDGSGLTNITFTLKNINQNYTNLLTDHTIIASSTNNPITNTLMNVSNKQYIIKRYGTNLVTIVSTNGWYIDGTNTSISINQDLQAITIQNDGNMWFIIGEYN